MYILPINTIDTNNYKENKSYTKASTTCTDETAFKAKKQQIKRVLPFVTTLAGIRTANKKSNQPNNTIPSKDICELPKKPLNAQSQDVTQDNIPTREEFENTISYKIPRYDEAFQSWLDCYDKSPEYALKFWNMKNSAGVSLLDSGAYDNMKVYDAFSCSYRPVFPINNVKKLKVNDIANYYMALQKLVDLKDNKDSVIISNMDTAVDIITYLSYSADSFSQIKFDGVIRILTLKDSNDNFRFDVNNNDLSDEIRGAAEFFGRYPEEAAKYALEKDENGKFKFNLCDLRDIASSVH